ncbi:MAG: NUMOD1 domain-containing DNA-binding protein [Lachnospiraceae bacterium]|nr:NUMOD1 domain-containing DNA-binding protein [Lachnospiraceae bacterium]
MEYKCKIPVKGSEKTIINKLLKQVKKEWIIEEVIKSSSEFSVTYEDEFEEGESICYFVKIEDYLYYCGPINVRKKKMEYYRLWVFDYIFYLNNKMYKINNLSYMWDTLSLKKIHENLIFNPCIVGNYDGVWQILNVKAVYDAKMFKDLVVVDMCPNSDNIDRTYTLTFYKNGYEIKKLEDICDFEPSLLRPGVFYYKANNIMDYIEYDFSSGKECESKNDLESRIYQREETDFWELFHLESDVKYIPNKKMEAEEWELFQKRIPRQTFGYHEYYFAVKNPIAEIIIKDYFAHNAEVELLKPMFLEDFSHNYRIRIINDNMNIVYLWLFLWKEGMVTYPSVCGVEIRGVIRYLTKKIYVGDKKEIETVVNTILRRTSKNSKDIIKYWMTVYPYNALLYSGYMTDKNEYYYLCNNFDDIRREYSIVLQKLTEEGKINARWKSEFSLFMLVKSYFPNTIYQYRSTWLEGQSLDMYIPELSMGIEYQGMQHYEAIDVFGGEEGLKNARRRDEMKREKCKEKGVKLVEWNYKTDITDISFIEILNNLHIEVPQKKQAEFTFEKGLAKIEVKKWAVYQYTLNGEFVAEYLNTAEAAKISGIREFNIQRACRGFRSTAGGYQWRKVELPCDKNCIAAVIEKRSSGEARKVIQFSLDGHYIRMYESIAGAVRETGINSKSIRDAANGKQKQAGGYKWEYDR